MKKVFLHISAVLALAAMVLFTSSCSRETKVTAENIDEYVIVREDGASYEIRKVCTDVWKAIRKLTGHELPILYESEAGEYEKKIIVGKYGTDEYADFVWDIRENDYAYGMSGQSFVISGVVDEKTCEAAEKFCEYVAGLKDEKNPVIIGDSVSCFSRAEYDVDSLKINSADIREYTVVYPSDEVYGKALAEGFTDAVRLKTGFILNMVPDSEQYDGVGIKISDPDGLAEEDGYRIDADANGNVIISGGSKNSVRSAVKYLADMIVDMDTETGEIVVAGGVVGEVKSLEPLKVMTFNILENDRDDRIDAVIGTILKYMPDTIGFQEANDQWMDILTERLDGIYDYYHTENTDKTPVFYLKDKWELVDGKQLALSETPNEPGTMVQGAVFTRSVYILLLERNSDGFRYYHINTHFQPIENDSGEKVRAREAEVVLGMVKDLEDYPMFFTGDLNSTTEERAHELFRENKFYNALSLADEKITTGTTWCGDFTDIDRDFSDPDGLVIDHIYIRSPWLDTMTYQVIRETYNGVYPSDHFPVITEIMPIE